jgi:hypothetical protein
VLGPPREWENPTPLEAVPDFDYKYLQILVVHNQVKQHYQREKKNGMNYST